MSISLHIKLLGDFSLTVNGHPIAGVNSERLQALLAFILLHRDTPQSRQQIAVQLWSDATDADAKANLRRRLHELKQLIPEIDRWLRVEAKTVQWVEGEGCFFDVAAFQSAIVLPPSSQTQALENAVNLYQGDLLPSCYDDWISPHREQLRQQAIAALDRLITLLTTQGNTPSAIRYAQQLQRIDPLYEPAYCHLMRLYAQAGNRASALRVYHQCMTTLQEELGVNPSPTTSKLYGELLVLEDAPVSPNVVNEPLSTIALAKPVLAASDLPLIGRKAEWSAIQQWITSCRDGLRSHSVDRNRADLLLLRGEPGIGKTRLLEELVRTIESTGGSVLWGRGFEAEMLRPYGVWVDAFQAIGATEFIHELRLALNADASAGLNRERLFELAARFMAQLSEATPVLIVLDDIQWLDETSIAFLHYATRRLSHLPVWFACAARKREIETHLSAYKFIQALHREQSIQVVDLVSLDRVQTLALAQAVGCEDCDQIFINSGGNPLFALEIARAHSQSAGASHNTLETLIQGRLVQLDDMTRDLVSWAAALGRSFNPTILTQVMDLPLPRLLSAIDQLEQHGIIRPGTALDGEIAYDFAHDIVRQVAYEQFSEPRRRLIHTHIAHALNALTAAKTKLINDVAHHADLGSDHALAVTASLMAAERCLRVFAYAEAATLAQRGIRHCRYLEATSRVRLHLGLLKAYVKAGVPKEQVTTLQQELQQLIQEAAELKLSDEAAIGLEALIVLNYDHGNLSEVQQHSLRAAEQGRTASPATTMYMLAHTGACLAEIGRDIARAETLLLEAQSIGDRLGLDTIDVPFGLGCVRRYQGQVEEARSLLRQGWQMAQRAQDHWRECTALTNLVMLELEAKQPAQALGYCSELIRVSEQMGEGSEASHAAALDAVARYLLQEKNAEEAIERSCQVLKKIDSPRILSYIQTLAATQDLEQGNINQALRRAEEALEAAQVIDNLSEISLAAAIVIQANCQLKQIDRAKQHWFDLQAKLNDHRLSALAQQKIIQLEKELDQLSAGGSKL